MKRTTIMADQDVLDRLRDIAEQEDVSLAEIIRQALDDRLVRPRRIPSFIGSITETGPNDPGHPTAAEISDWIPEPPPWR